MADTVEGKIADLLLTALQNLPFSPAYEIAYPGVDYPAAGQNKADEYLEVMILRNTTANFGISDDSSSIFRGILQISIMSKPGIGIVPASDIAGQILTAFPKGRELRDGDVTVKISKRGSLATAYPDGAHLRSPVSIPFVCFAAAN